MILLQQTVTVDAAAVATTDVAATDAAGLAICLEMAAATDAAASSGFFYFYPAVRIMTDADVAAIAAYSAVTAAVGSS